MQSNKPILGGVNEAIEYQEKTVADLEDRLFMEPIRLAALSGTKQRILRRTIGGSNGEKVEESEA